MVGLRVGPKGQLSRWALWLLLSRVKPPPLRFSVSFSPHWAGPASPGCWVAHGHVDILSSVVIPVWRRDRGL